MKTSSTGDQLLDERHRGVALDAEGRHTSLAHGGNALNNVVPLVDVGADDVHSRVDHVPMLEVGNLALLAISGAIQAVQETLEPDQP